MTLSMRTGIAGVLRQARQAGSNPGFIWRYSVAALAVIAATAVRIALESPLGVYSLYLPFALAVMVAARVGGRGPGLAATVLSALIVAWLFLEPRHSFDIRDPAEVAGLTLFVATATLISLLIGDLRESLLSTARAQAALRQAHSDELTRVKELQAIMDSVPVAVFVSHDPECRNIIGNRSAYRLVRAPPGSNLSISPPGGEKPAAYRLVKDGKEIPPHELPMNKAAATGQPLYFVELELVLEDGDRRNIIGSAVPLLDPENRSRGSVGTFVDITERRQNAERLRQAQKLESIGLLAGGIAHDFNNLLTVIIGNADSALNNYPAIKEIQHIMSASERAAELTRQLLAYAGKGRFVAMTFNLSDLVSRSMQLLSASISQKVELVFHLSERELPIKADPSQIEQVLMNLVINAGEAIPPRAEGRIEIATSIYEAAPEIVCAHAPAFDARPGRFACLEVTDNGSGMDEETRRQMFDPFFSTKFTGRGLGLAEVQGIVRSCGGFIDVESSSGAGSRFRVFLPAGETKSATKIPAVTQPDGSRRRDRRHAAILVVEDEEMVRQLASMALRSHGYEVLEAENGKHALEVLAGAAPLPSLVLLDMTMPKMGGEELVPILNHDYPDLRIIVTSGYPEEDLQKEFPPGAVAGFLQKPYTIAALTEKVEETISSGDPDEEAPDAA
jgi:two-component system cell cycle sensor histidine kinase/response regulator CckA